MSPPRPSTCRCRRYPEPALPSSSPSKKSSYIFISHDLAVVRYLSDHIGVMYPGWLMEIGEGRGRLRGRRSVPTPRPWSLRFPRSTSSIRGPASRSRAPSPASASPLGLPLPHAVSPLPGRYLRARGAAVARHRRGTPLSLPHRAGRARAPATRAGGTVGRLALTAERHHEVFNDVIGPVMQSGSSSHAGPCRVGPKSCGATSLESSPEPTSSRSGSRSGGSR